MPEGSVRNARGTIRSTVRNRPGNRVHRSGNAFAAQTSSDSQATAVTASQVQANMVHEFGSTEEQENFANKERWGETWDHSLHYTTRELSDLYRKALGSVREEPTLDLPDSQWAQWFFELAKGLSSTRSDIPSGKVGNDIVEFVTALLNEVIDDPNGDSFKPLVFLTCVTQRNKHATTFRRSKENMVVVLTDFKAGRYREAIDKVLRWERELVSRGGRNRGRAPPGASNESERFERLVLSGRMRKAVRLAAGNAQGTKVLSAADVVDRESGRMAFDDLRSKHPRPAPVAREALRELEQLLANGDVPEPEPWIVSDKDVDEAVKNLDGSAGVTGNDAASWRAMLTKHGLRSEELRKAIARLTTIMGAADVPWKKLEGLRVCRLVALGYENANGYKVRPLGIGEVLARLLSQLAVRKTRQELIDNIGIDNLVVGVPGGCEGAVKAASELLRSLQSAASDVQAEIEPGKLPAMLLLDASNAFNCQPRAVCLLMCRLLWPSMARYALNVYRGDAWLCIEGKVLQSCEGTTQGCPLAGLLYAVGIHGLQKQVRELTVRGSLSRAMAAPSPPQAAAAEPDDQGPAQPDEPAAAADGADHEAPMQHSQLHVPATPPSQQGEQTAPRPAADAEANRPPPTYIDRYKEAIADFNYADDSAGVGYLDLLARWYRAIADKGPAFGYHINPAKLVLIVPDRQLVDTVRTFVQTAYDGAFASASVQSGDMYLGGYVGDDEGRRAATAAKVAAWTEEVKRLAQVAATKPHAHYRCLTMSVQHRPTYYQRTVATDASDFAPLEAAVRLTAVPAITGRAEPVTDAEWEMLTLPARKGGLGITRATQSGGPCFETATASTSFLAGALIGKHEWRVTDHLSAFTAARAKHKKEAETRADAIVAALLADESPTALPPLTKRGLRRANKYHTSAWLTVMLSRDSGLVLSPYEFRDGIALRYVWNPVEVGTACSGCGQPFTMAHVQSCEVGPMRKDRHDYFRDMLKSWLEEATAQGAAQREADIALPQPARRTNAANTNPQRAANAAWPGQWREKDGSMDVRVHGLRGLGLVDDIDVRIMHLDCDSYVASGKSVEVLFEETAIKPKRNKYEAACRALGHRFVPFAVSTDGVLSDPAKEFVKLMATKTAEKWGMRSPGQMSWVMAMLRAKIAVAIVKGASWCIRGDRSTRSRYVDARLASFSAEQRAELRYMFSSQASRLHV